MSFNKKFIGWIRPNGSLLPCGKGDHLGVARAVGVRSPDDAGWVHVDLQASGDRYDVAVQPVSHMTAKQLDVLGQVCMEAGQMLPVWVSDVTVT
jgi:hypothetical protein